VLVGGSGGTLTMTGGLISGNTAAGSGGGVAVMGSGAFNMRGAAEVHTGNKVYLSPGKVITLTGSLSADPAANIETTASIGTAVLGGVISGQDYQRFLVNGEPGKIDSAGKLF
jgi:hypothetical protein